MSIPAYRSIMLPLLKLLSNKEERSLKDCVSEIAKSFKLSEHEKGQLLPSGGQTSNTQPNGMGKDLLGEGWLAYLNQAGILSDFRRWTKTFR